MIDKPSNGEPEFPTEIPDVKVKVWISILDYFRIPVREV